ncbi:MAG: hypothetical protein QNK94_09325, partial [Comamonadaceae bacterium]
DASSVLSLQATRARAAAISASFVFMCMEVLDSTWLNCSAGSLLGTSLTRSHAGNGNPDAKRLHGRESTRASIQGFTLSP